MAETLGKRNPFRYRGYVWDEETGLYYLRSRYYDPELGRFLNEDIYLGEIGGVINSNMYAYAKCNPIMRIDKDGTIDYVFSSSDFRDVFLIRNLDQRDERNFFVQVEGKIYPANSYETISLYKWTGVELDFMETSFYPMIEAASEYSGIIGVFSQSVTGKLNFKSQLPEKLFLIDGIVYNRNEAGNFMWSYFLMKHGYPRIFDDLLAQGGSIYDQHRFDEPHDVKARKAGEEYWLRENN